MSSEELHSYAKTQYQKYETLLLIVEKDNLPPNIVQ